MSVTTINLEMDTEQMRKIFGMQDAYIKKLEQDYRRRGEYRKGFPGIKAIDGTVGSRK